MMLYYFLVTLLTVTSVFGESDGNRTCTLSDIRRISSCYESMGFNHRPGQYWNISSMAVYCSVPGRTEGNHCLTSFSSRCPITLSNVADPSKFNERIEFSSKALDYICSGKNVIESNQECIQTSIRQVNTCFVDAVNSIQREYRQRIRQGLTQDEILQTSLTLAGRVEICVVRVTRQECNDDLADLVGNFLYAMYTYVTQI